MEEDRDQKKETEDVEIVEEDGLTSSLAKVKKELALCRKEKEEYLAGWQRARADFINREREFASREKTFFESAERKFIGKILCILDHFEKAFASSPPASPWVSGIRQILSEVEKMLKDFEITPMEAVGEKFDPHFHEAVERVETKNEDKDGVVVEEVEKGYLRREEVMRPAKVKVAYFRE